AASCSAYVVQRVASPVYNAEAMTLSKMARLLLALASGVVLVLAFPLFNLPILAWVASAGLILAALNQRPGFAFLLGWLQGAVFYVLSVPWIYTVMRQYGPLTVPEAGGLLMFVCFACASFHLSS